MKILIRLLFILCLFLPIRLAAQDYRCIDPERPGLFSYTELCINMEHVTLLRIDSLWTEGEDTVLMPMRNLRQTDTCCFTPYGPSWIGDRVVVKPDGTTLFFNHLMDTILIHTRAKLNDTWIAYRGEDFYVEGEIYELNYEDVLKLTDSVKHIRFRAYDYSDHAIEHDLEAIELWISRENGLVKTPNFYFFPDHYEILSNPWEPEWYFPLFSYEECMLLGLSNPDIGWQPMNWKDIWDFSVGDEFHITEYEINEVGGYQYIWKVLDIEQETDSTRLYYIDQIRRGWDHSGEYPRPVYTRDTITTTNHPNGFFYTQPGEVWVDDYFDEAVRPLQTLSKYYNSDCWTRFYPEDKAGDCWRTSCNFFEDPYEEQWYLRGLGGRYYRYSEIWEGYERVRELEYYRKGDVTWGRPFVFNDLAGANENTMIRLFPNPVRETVNLELKQYTTTWQYRICNSLGLLLIESQPINQSSTAIDISELKDGVYYLQVFCGEGPCGSIGFIKR